MAKPEDADALAWVFSSPDKFEKYYFKFPPLGKDEIRARVIYASLCHGDPIMGRSQFEKTTYPKCPGHEVVGELMMVGENVKDFKVGDKVALGPLRSSCQKCMMCQKGCDNACDMDINDRVMGLNNFGGFATHIQQSTQYCFKIPDGLDMAKTASLMCAGTHGFTSVSMYGTKESKVAVFGCGGFGHMAIQYASKMCAEVDAFTTNKSKEGLLKKLGAKNVILWDDFYAQDKIEKKYDLVICTLPVWPSSDKVKKWLASMVPFGKIVLIGIIDMKEIKNCDVKNLVFHQISLVGSFCGSRKQIEEMLKFSKDNHIEPICEFFDFEDFPNALEKTERSMMQMKGVVRVEETAKKIEQKHK